LLVDIGRSATKRNRFVARAGRQRRPRRHEADSFNIDMSFRVQFMVIIGGIGCLTSRSSARA
jgi:hypothetical protein